MQDKMSMGRETETSRFVAADDIAQTLEGRYVCPFCGAVREQPEGVCARCTMESSPATRQATKSRIGPWYVLQTRNPAAPGMKFETLLAFVRKGRVRAQSIVRGPTTHQLWRFAAHVKGLSREFDVCYSCGHTIAREATVCLHCNRLQDPPANPDVFLESTEPASPPMPGPIYRDIGQAPLVSEDIVVPTMPTSPSTEVADLNAAAPAEGLPSLTSPAKKLDLSRKGSDGFLTAADLATAFQLDFQPKERKHNKKTPVAPIDMTRDGQESPTPPRPRRRATVVSLVLLIAAIGATALLYQRSPGFRSHLQHGYDVVSTWTRDKWAQSQRPAPKPSHSPPNDVIPVQMPTHPDSGKNGAPAPQPATSANPWDKLYHQQASDSNVSADKPEKVATAPPKPKHRTGTMDDVRALYGSALDAEGQHDYATAVQKYQEIKEFPSDLWPSDLELRLKAAKLQMH